MKVFYQGRDITKDVDVRKCLYTDVSGGRRDLMDIEIEYSEKWFGWQPDADDRIRVTQGGLDTGELYVNAVLPEQGKYRIIATGAKSAARRRAFQSFEGKTLGAIMGLCAAECGMSQGLYGISAAIEYQYLLRENEEAAAFMDRLLIYEGGRLKCTNGKLRGIGIEYAQERPAGHEIEIDSRQMQAMYLRREDMKWAGVTIRTPFAEASAYDSAAGGSNHPVITDLPVKDAAQAGRWARGLLMAHNRQAEELTIGTELNAGLMALERIDIASETDAGGNWIVDEATHDLILMKSRARLLRCITTIG